jgi:phenylacetate-CoA ligase
VLNSWSYGTHNGAFCFDEALYQWLNCVVLTTSTGNVTSTEKQVELAIQYGATAILTTGDYLLRIADAAKDLGYDPANDLKIRALPNIGDRGARRRSARSTTAATASTSAVGGQQCPMPTSLHIYEDGFIVQIVDVETGEPLPDDELDRSASPALKTGSSQFATTSWTSRTLPPGQCGCGRGCEMGPPRAVRQHGRCVASTWPEAVGDIACSVDGVAPTTCACAPGAKRDELIACGIRSRRGVRAIRSEIERLQQQLGLKIAATSSLPVARRPHRDPHVP